MDLYTALTASLVFVIVVTIVVVVGVTIFTRTIEYQGRDIVEKNPIISSIITFLVVITFLTVTLMNL